jgi:hypothetical protein
MNKALLQNWVQHGLALADLGDGAWGWTEAGKAKASPMIRYLLSQLLEGSKIPNFLFPDLQKSGFDENGFVLTDEE